MTAPPAVAADEQPLVSVRQASKKFCRSLEHSLRYGFKDLARELLGRPRRSTELRAEEFWSLEQVSFELRRGESVALIGRNGAGKSTLLQLLTGRLKLDRGRISVRGSLGLVTELGAGFNPVQTGRENVYNCGAVFGLSRQKIDSIYHEIVAFAELEDAMQTPLQTYSSGMRARLGYAVVAHIRPDVLMADEVLAVGDVAFRRKCLQHMLRYVKSGGTLVLVGHDMYAMQSICARCIVLEQGKVLYDGPSPEGFSLYYELIKQRSHSNDNGDEGDELPEEWKPSTAAARPAASAAAGTEPDSRYPVVIDGLSIRREDGQPLRTGQPAQVELYYRSLRRFEGVGWGFNIHTGDRATRIATAVAGLGGDGRRFDLEAGAGSLSCRIERLPLVPGRYLLDGVIGDPETKALLAEFGTVGRLPLRFNVTAEVSPVNNVYAAVGSLVALETTWDAAR